MNDKQTRVSGLLGNADFLKFWFGQAASYVGDRIAQMAFLGLLVSAYGKSSSEMAKITFFGLLPTFLFGGIAGGFVDRLSRKSVLVVTNLLRALTVLSLALLVLGPPLPLTAVYAVIFLIGVCTAFFVPARLSILPALVEDKDLQTANALTAGAGMIAALVGTYFAGTLIEQAGLQKSFYVNAALYAVAAVFLGLIGKTRPAGSCAAAQAGPAGGAREAMTYLRAHRRVPGLIFLSIVLSFLSSFFYIALTVLAMDYYRLGTEGMGRLLTMVGVGMLAGSALAAVLGRRVKLTHLLLVSFSTLFVTTATAGLVRTYALAWVWLVLIGAANALILVSIDTVLQRIVPDRFRGKVFGLRGMATSGVFLLSLLAVAEILKTASPFAVFGILAWTSLAIAVFILFVQENFSYLIFRFVLRFFLKLFFSLRIEGEEFLRYRGSVILAGNHTGFLDGPIVISTFNRPVKFLVSKKVFSWPVIGPLVKRAGVVPVEEGKGAEALRGALSQLARGRAIGIFPEGRLTRDGKIGSFYKGVAQLHKDSGAPIVPFVIHGGFEAWPWHRRFPVARRVVLQFGQPIEQSPKPPAELIDEIRDRIQFMKEALERRGEARRGEEAYTESALSLMQQKSDRYGARSALLLKEKLDWKELSYIELSRKARDLSDFLIAAGLERGDRIAILSESRPEWAVAFFASIRTGAITVPLDIKLTDTELKSILSDAQPKVLFTSRGHLPSARLLKESVSSIERVIILDDEGEAEFPAYAALRSPGVLEGRERKAGETALIIYTSGTTGNPKGVMISFSNLIFQVRSFEEIMNLQSDDMFLSILPLNHLLELTAGFLGVLHAGGRICYSQSLYPQEIAKIMKEKRVTFMIAVPLFLKMLKSSVEKQIKKSGPSRQRAFDVLFALAKTVPSRRFRKFLFGEIHRQFGGRLRGFLSGGAPLDIEVAEFFETIGIPVYQGYGLSETSPVISGNTPSHNRLGSVGRALRGVEVRIAADGGPEAEGEILTRGPHVMQGYYKRDDLTREVIDAGGWFHTGDLGRLDRDGYLHITGRIKNLIVLGGGKKIHPEEVESVLASAPSVKEACVLSRVLKGGLKDGTEEVCAVIVPSDDLKKKHGGDAAAIQLEVRKDVDAVSQNLASYKRPSSVLIHPEELPKTATRKIKRPLVAEWLKGQG